MSLFAATETKFTLIDIHPESIGTAERIVRSLELADRVEDFEIADAGAFEVDAEAKPDIIVIEMLRAALESEPQAAVASNLGAQARDAVVIPEEVTIDLALVNSGREFSLEQELPERDRIFLGKVFELDRGVRSGSSSITLPDYDTSRYQLMLLTTVRVYGDHILRDYDSGITCPKELRMDASTGNAIEFNYELGPHPRLVAKRRTSQ